MNIKLKEQHLFEIEIFYNIANVFTVTFDQFNASFFFYKIINDLILNGSVCITVLL